MKILIATSHRNVVGGVETYLQTVIPALLERGHEIGMLYDYVGDSARPTVDPAAEELPVWFASRFQQQPELWTELLEWMPDAVYSQGSGLPEIDRKLQESFSTIRYVHDYWGTCTTGRKCHSIHDIRPCQRTFGPMCLALHYPLRCGGLNPSLAWKMFQTASANNALLAGYQAVLVASTHMHSEFKRNGVDPEKLHLVRYPLPDSPGREPAFSKVPGGRLLFVGRLTDVKGADYLIRAIPPAEAKLGQKLSLTVAGDGPELGKLRELARRKQIAVEFRGWVNPSEKIELMQQADLLVVPSLWPEPFGLVGVEAGRQGLPAAGFASGGIPDWLIAGQTGELAPGDPPTEHGLADAIARAIADPDHYNQLQRGAFELSRQFTVAGHLAELEAVFNANASARPSHSTRAGRVLSFQDGHK